MNDQKQVLVVGMAGVRCHKECTFSTLGAAWLKHVMTAGGRRNGQNSKESGEARVDDAA
jgi:hypothetical protein